VFVRKLLAHLETVGLDCVPRYLGRDEDGRETFTFVPGVVPADLDPGFPDQVLVAAARLIRRFHDATAGAEVAGSAETVCHGDLSPCNFVFRDGEPVAIIDFDAAAPADRLLDLGYAAFLWLNLGTDGLPVGEQARRLALFCRAYGVEPDRKVVLAINAAVDENVARLQLDGRLADVVWWRTQHDWLLAHEDEITALLSSSGD
jgi:Ser/Thr protein kinase RdoA (MazF antagonist)